MLSTRYSCPISMKLEFSRQIFEKIPKYKISCKSVRLEPSCSMRTNVTTLSLFAILRTRLKRACTSIHDPLDKIFIIGH